MGADNQVAVQAINSCSLFQGIDPQGLAILLAECREVVRKAGEAIAAAGEISPGLLLGLEGEAAERLGESPFGVYLPGEVMVTSEAQTGAPLQTSLVALTEWKGLCFPRGVVAGLAADYPNFSQKLEEHTAEHARRSYLAQRVRRIFNEFTPEIFKDFQSRVTWHYLQRGEVLEQKGKYHSLVHGGLSELDAEGQVLREILPGQTIGGTNFAGQAASHPIIASRDSELIAIANDRHLELFSKYPVYLKAFFQSLECPSTEETLGDSFIARTVTLIPVHGTPEVVEWIHRITLSLSQTALQVLDSKKVAELTGVSNVSQADDTVMRRLNWWMNSQERKFRYLFYVADVEPTVWTKLCVRNADRVVIVGQADRSPALTETEATLLKEIPAERKTLVLLHKKSTSEPKGTAAWLKDRAVQHHFHCRKGIKEDGERLARFLTGRAVALVLGGGGARGFAHMGVIQAFKDCGIPIDIIGGASAGASVAAAYVAGWDYDRMLMDVPMVFQKAFAPTRVTVPFQSILSTANYDKMVWKYVPNIDIEDLPIPFFAVSSQLKSAEPYVFRYGPLPRAVAASGRVPGLLAPLSLADDHLVDGGVLDNLPVEAVREISQHASIVAVDVTGSTLNTEVRAEGRRAELLKRVMKYVPDFQLSLVTTLRRIAVLGSIRHVNDALRKSDTELYLSPPVESIPMGSFAHKNAAQAAQLGYEYAKPRLAQWWAEKRGL